ncbi:hypothetical protein [uncultured Acidaminococcus sp.]|uniref:hypothetical protein n=1 Tax=uncultured Acidaminococcus sp. TaxID=352152 RepID=UPI002676928D|nr:hypothetical protein [uncultured Acidaminococcus sp.]
MQWGVFLVPDGALADVPSFARGSPSESFLGLIPFFYLDMAFFLDGAVDFCLGHPFIAVNSLIFYVVYIGMTMRTLCKGHLFFYAGNTEES